MLSGVTLLTACTPKLANLTAVPSTHTPILTETITPQPSATPSATSTPTVTAETTPTATATQVELTEKAFVNLTDEEKQKIWDSAPAELDGLAKSNFSTILPYLILYRDGNGDSQIALNLLTKEKSTLLEAGIAEFDFVKVFEPTSTKGEMLAFVLDVSAGADEKTLGETDIEIIEKTLEYIVGSGVDWGWTPNGVKRDNPDKSEGKPEEPPLHPSRIPNISGGGGFATGVDMKNSFWLGYLNISYLGRDCAIVMYKSEDSIYDSMYEYVLVAVQGDRLKELMMESKVTVPPNPQFIQTP